MFYSPLDFARKFSRDSKTRKKNSQCFS